MNYNLLTSTDTKDKKKSVYLTGVIDGRKHQCLIDTGSEINLIPARLTEGRNVEATPQRLIAANGSEIDLIGQVGVYISFDGIDEQQMTFLVSSGIEEIVLGMDFLINNDCQVDFVTNEVSIGRKKVTNTVQSQVWKCRCMRTGENSTQ